MGITIQVSPRVRLVIDDGNDEVLSNKHESYTAEQLGLAMTGADHVRYWRDRLGLHKNAYERARAEALPGWRLARTLGPLQWINETEAAVVLEAHDIEPRRVMTPVEVRRADGRAAPLIERLAHHPFVEPTLIPATFKGTLLNDESDAEVRCE